LPAQLTAHSNVFIEQLWRSVKYEDVYLKAYASLTETRHGLSSYFAMYNTQRPHQGLAYRTPDAVYFGLPAMQQAA
jgi:putative transposase